MCCPRSASTLWGGSRSDCLVNRWDKCIRLHLESGNVAGSPGGEWTSGSIRENVLQPSTYIWEHEHNVVHSIHQGEGGEQGDALMPLLFSVGQHGREGGQAVSRFLCPSEKLFAFLDDIYVLCPPARVVEVYVFFRQSCGDMQESRSMGERPRSGTKPACILEDVKFWSALPSKRIQRQLCGQVLGCPQNSKG